MEDSAGTVAEKVIFSQAQLPMPGQSSEETEAPSRVESPLETNYARPRRQVACLPRKRADKGARPQAGQRLCRGVRRILSNPAR